MSWIYAHLVLCILTVWFHLHLILCLKWTYVLGDVLNESSRSLWDTIWSCDSLRKGGNKPWCFSPKLLWTDHLLFLCILLLISMHIELLFTIILIMLKYVPWFQLFINCNPIITRNFVSCAVTNTRELPAAAYEKEFALEWYLW